MKLDEFINNLRGIDAGHDIDMYHFWIFCNCVIQSYLRGNSKKLEFLTWTSYENNKITKINFLSDYQNILIEFY